MNDSNPGAPVMAIEINASVTKIEMRINGYLHNTYGAGTTSIIMPTLNPMGGGSPYATQVDNGLDLTAYNSVGSSATAYLGIARPRDTVSGQGGVFARYYNLNGTDISVENASFTRHVDLYVLYANYSCATVGARNGRVFHWTVNDILGWNDLYPTPAWTAYYDMQSLPVPQKFDERPCDARFPPGGPANQMALCTQPASFAFDGRTSGAATIASFAMGNYYLAMPTQLAGDTTQPVYP